MKYIALHSLKLGPGQPYITPGDIVVLEDEKEAARLLALKAIVPAPDYERRRQPSGKDAK